MIHSVQFYYRAMHYSAKHGLAIACHLSVRLSICLWSWWIMTTRTVSLTSSLFAAQRSSTYSQGNMETFWGENVRSTPTSITSGWIESTESHVILGGGVAVCLRLSAHRAVIFAITQLSCNLWAVSIVVTAPHYTSVVSAVIVCLSVCLSVRSWCSNKTAKRRIMQTVPHDSPWTVVFWSQSSWRNLNAVTPNGQQCRWVTLKLMTIDK